MRKMENGNPAYFLFVAILAVCLLRIEVIFEILHSLFKLSKPIITAFMFALAIDAPASFFERKLYFIQNLQHRRFISVVITLVSFVLGFAAVLYYLLPRLIEASGQLAERVPQYILRAVDCFAPILSRYDLDISALGFARGLDAGVLFERVTRSLASVADSISSSSKLLLSFALSIYILFDKRKLLRNLERTKCLFPRTELREKCYSFFYLCAITFKHFIAGQMLEGAILGCLCFVGMSLIGLPYALLISVFVGITSVIPVVGAYIGAIPAVVLLLLESPIQAGIFLLFLIPLQQFEGSVIYPRIVGEAIGMSGFFVFAAIILGSGVAGVTGVIVAVPLMAVAHNLFSTWLKRKESE